MSRPKGSRNKTTAIKNPSEAMLKVQKEIVALEEQIKAKKAELELLAKAKLDEDKTKLYEAVEASGKSLEEVLELLK